MADKLYRLDQIRPEHLTLVGHKAVHLSRLLQKGHPVVPGFVVSARVFRNFLETIDWSDPLFADIPNSSLRLDIDNPRQLQAIAQQLQQTIESAPLPTDLLLELESTVVELAHPVLILRPSLVVNPAARPDHSKLNDLQLCKSSGLMNTQICQAEGSAFAQALKRLWSGLFGAKSLFYWQRLGIHLQHVHLAVLVQPIQPAIAAGVVHTTGTQFEIQAAPGLGMAIAWGEVVPDTYQVDAETGEIQTQQLGWKTIAYNLSPRSRILGDRQYKTFDDPEVQDRKATEIGSSGGSDSPQFSPAGFSATASRSSKEKFLESASVILEAQFLNHEHQQRYALSQVNFNALIQLVQRAVTEMGPLLELEWVLWNWTEDAPRPYLTQVTPQTAIGRKSEVLPIRKLKNGESEQFSASSIVSANHAPTAFPDTQLVVVGLAASGGQAIANACVIAHTDELPQNIPPGTVLVAPTIPLDWLPLIRQTAAVVIEQGSLTSHSAIIAREIGIPAVMGAIYATQRIQPGDRLWVDGNQGRVFRVSNQADHLLTEIRTEHAGITADKYPSQSTHRPPIGTQLMVNVSQLDRLEQISALPIDGIGLLRAELLAIAALDAQHPAKWLQQNREAELVERMAASIGQFAQAMTPRSVFYRSFDLRTHEFHSPSHDVLPPSAQSVLGVRGTLSYMLNPTLFKLELAAIAQVHQSGYPNVHLMLPFVRTVEEFVFCQQLVEQAGLKRNPHFQLWIMAEVPSVLLLLPDYVKAGVQGISIGTNDLTQLLLGVDRDQAQIAAAFEERHPAVKRAIAQLIQQARDIGIPCSICGEAPVRYPELIDDLIQWGIPSISVAPEAVDSTYWAIVRAERNLVLQAARNQRGDSK